MFNFPSPLSQKGASPLMQLCDVENTWGEHRSGPFTLSIEKSERIAILGPSGAGKSSLLKLMAGEAHPLKGNIVFQNKALSRWSLAELSRKRAVLPQSSHVAFALPVELVIGLGRLSCQGGAVSSGSRKIVEEAASMARASHLLGRRVDTLSGGELARVQLARILAQLWDAENGLVLVDEPLASLDPGLQLEVLDSLDHYAAQRGHALVAVLHDINQALHGFERLWLIKNGQIQEDMASSGEVVPALEALYEVALHASADEYGQPILMPKRTTVRRTSSHAPTANWPIQGVFGAKVGVA